MPIPAPSLDLLLEQDEPHALVQALKDAAEVMTSRALLRTTDQNLHKAWGLVGDHANAALVALDKLNETPPRDPIAA